MKKIELGKIKGKLRINQRTSRNVHQKNHLDQIFNRYPKIDCLKTKNRRKKKLEKELAKIK
jgi:hypothetical protein